MHCQDGKQHGRIEEAVVKRYVGRHDLLKRQLRAKPTSLLDHRGGRIDANHLIALLGEHRRNPTQGHGYAAEMVRALIDWAFTQPGVLRIIAETTDDNAPSMRLLNRLGFARTEPAVEPGHIRLVLNRRADADKDSN